MTTRGVRMTEGYAAWLDRFAKSERMSVATLIDRALAAYAEAFILGIAPGACSMTCLIL